MAALTLEFGVAGSIAPGQRVSGDLEVVHYYDGGGGALVAVIDGIGHGEQAAATARLAADTILQRC
jgi:negative regulator of sigma-B (phosphoserine phosphatase)